MTIVDIVSTGLAGSLAGDAFARWRRRRRAMRESEVLCRDIAAKLDGLLLPQLRRLLNDVLRTPFDVLDVRRANGLSEVVDPSLEVPTRARAELSALLTHMSSGSVGISGARGAGKTTLIRAACDGRLSGEEENGQPPLGVWVSAPVRWEASEFIPFLFAEVCGAVAPWLRDTERESPARRRRDAAKLIGTFAVGVGCTALLAQQVSGIDPLRQIVAHVDVLGLAAATGMAALAVARQLTDRARRPLWQLAERRMWDLRYRETIVQGWAVDAKPGLLGIGLGRKRETTATEQPMTLPEVIGRYKGFVERIAQEHRLVIGIDELDKMDSAEDAARFLRDVKVLFGQQRCFYLISVSDDAMSEFERRGMPLRNVFDSSFDDVLHVEPLTFPEARAIVNGRVVGMGDAYVALCFLMSGGLPRELIRCARSVVGLGAIAERPVPAKVAREIVADRLQRAVRGAEAVAARHVGSDGRQPLIEWLGALPEVASAAALAPWWDVAAPYAALGTVALEAPERDAQRVMLVELAAIAYRAATILALFAGDARRLRASTSTGEPSPLLELLARAWHDLGRGPAAAWRTVDRAREQMGLAPYPFPIAAPAPSDGAPAMLTT
jgi:hypothetical protein